MTGCGEGYCAVRLPDEPGQTAYGYAGLQGTPVWTESPAARPMFGARSVCWLRPVMRPWRGQRTRSAFRLVVDRVLGKSRQ